MASCKGCALLQIDGPCRDGDCWSAHCLDADKPVLGERRVVAVSWAGPPVDVQRPAWCRDIKRPPVAVATQPTAGNEMR